MTSRRSHCLLSRILLTSVLLTSVAHAELTPIERATAEALFQEGVQLMDRGEYALACEKFAGTLELEPGLGTMLHLADCYDKVNRTASSWALFEEVASRAKLAGDATRQAIASDRASDLKSRLSLVYLEAKDVVPVPTAAARVRIKVGETLIPTAMWGSPIPLDPGQHRLYVAADGYQPWSFSLVVAPGPSLSRVTIPPLEIEPRAKPESVEKRPILTALPQPPAPGDAPSSSTPRVLGYVSGALGLVGLGISGYFGYRAYQSQQSSRDSCRASNANLCTADGVARRDDAFRFADAANVSAIAGGACLLVGTTLLIVSPPAAENNGATDGVRAFGVALRAPTLSLRRKW